jgi:glycosyltransferase involved in cell wall biosynthesis
MACGAALVSTDNGGVHAFAEHQKTALICPPQDTACIAEKILQLLEDRELRLSIAVEGNRHIRQFTWERSVTAMENVCFNSANMK